MKYDIALTEEAERKFLAYPPHQQNAIEAHLQELARSPSSLSHPAPSPPYAPGSGMVADLECMGESGLTARISIFFMFSQDETTILVQNFGRVNY
jgi:hypothetical protein